jgi:hypothetical protein
VADYFPEPPVPSRTVSNFPSTVGFEENVQDIKEEVSQPLTSESVESSPTNSTSSGGSESSDTEDDIEQGADDEAIIEALEEQIGSSFRPDVSLHNVEHIVQCSPCYEASTNYCSQTLSLEELSRSLDSALGVKEECSTYNIESEDDMDTSNGQIGNQILGQLSPPKPKPLSVSRPGPKSSKPKTSQLASHIDNKSPEKDVGQEMVTNILKELSSAPIKPLPYKGKTVPNLDKNSSKFADKTPDEVDNNRAAVNKPQALDPSFVQAMEHTPSSASRKVVRSSGSATKLADSAKKKQRLPLVQGRQVCYMSSYVYIEC